MREQDKAVEIINLFINITDDYKQCALVHVEQLIVQLEKYCEDYDIVLFYEKVKQKIELL